MWANANDGYLFKFKLGTPSFTDEDTCRGGGGSNRTWGQICKMTPHIKWYLGRNRWHLAMGTHASKVHNRDKSYCLDMKLQLKWHQFQSLATITKCTVTVPQDQHSFLFRCYKESSLVFRKNKLVCCFIKKDATNIIVWNVSCLR